MIRMKESYTFIQTMNLQETGVCSWVHRRKDIVRCRGALYNYSARVSDRMSLLFLQPATAMCFGPQARLTPSNWSALYRGGGSPVMSWILLKANNGQQVSGVGDKRFFCFKRNAYHLWTAIIRHRLNDITHQQAMRLNQASKFANIFEVHLKHPQCFGTLAQPCHFLLNTPVMTQRIFPGPARIEWLWVNDIGPMNTIYGTGDPALVDMWRTSHQNMKYQS